MIVTFCGHAQYIASKEDEQKMMALLTSLVGDLPADLFFGGYGSFDSFALHCGKRYQESHPNVKLIFVTPYLTANYQKNHLNCQKDLYDEIIYPHLEEKPLKYAISYRNKWMVEQADFVIAYITHEWGGAHQTYRYAKRNKTPIFNLSGKEF